MTIPEGAGDDSRWYAENTRRLAFETADRLQRNLIREWLALDPFGGPQRRYRRACSCGHNRYCGPRCGAHTE